MEIKAKTSENFFSKNANLDSMSDKNELNSQNNYMSSNNSKSNKQGVPRWSLENIDFEKPRNPLKKINSPKSLEALFRLGFSEEDLYLIPFKNFLSVYPNIRGFHKDLQRSTYDYYEAKRLEKIQESRKERRNIIKQLEEDEKNNIESEQQNWEVNQNNENGFINDNDNPNPNHKQMSKTFQNKTNSNVALNKPAAKENSPSQSKTLFKSTAINNDLKQFERLKKKQELEIMNLLQNELKMEMLRKENEEKMKRKRDKDESLKKHYQAQQKLEEERRQKIEREKAEKMRLDEEERKKLDQRLYHEEQEKLKKDAERERERLKEQKRKQEEEKRKQAEYQQMIEKMLEETRSKAETRKKALDEKNKLRQQILEKKRRQLAQENQRKALLKQEKILLNTRNLEQKINEQRECLLRKQQENERKKLGFERLRELAFKQRQIQSAKRAEEISKVLQKNELIEKQRLEEYREKQELISFRKQELEDMQREIARDRAELNEQRENELKERMEKYLADEEARKREILDKIEIRGYKIANLQKEKEREIMERSEFLTKRRIEKEENIKRIARLQDYDRSKVLERLQEKSLKVEEFIMQKSLIAEKKREMQGVISEKKKDLMQKFERIFKKKNLDEDAINSLQSMFPDSPMFSKILDTMRGDFSKSNHINDVNINNYDSQEPIRERAKSSLNRKNVFSTKHSLPEMKQINHNYQANNKYINMKNTSLTRDDAFHNDSNKEAHLFSYNNNNVTSSKRDFNSINNFNNSYNNNYKSTLAQQDFNRKIKKSETFNINNFRLSNKDFHYSNQLDSVKISGKTGEHLNIASEKTLGNTNINYNNNSDYPVDNKKIDPEKLIHDYRLQLNKELLRRLFEEREKENIRDKLLSNARDYNERKKMEQRFIYERAQASAEIIQINEEIDRKLNEFKNKLLQRNKMKGSA